MIRSATLLLLTLFLPAGCGGSDKTGAPQPAPESDVQELANVLELRADFAAAAGKPRAIVLLSPT